MYLQAWNRNASRIVQLPLALKLKKERRKAPESSPRQRNRASADELVSFAAGGALHGGPVCIPPAARVSTGRLEGTNRCPDGVLEESRRQRRKALPADGSGCRRVVHRGRHGRTGSNEFGCIWAPAYRSRISVLHRHDAPGTMDRRSSVQASPDLRITSAASR